MVFSSEFEGTVKRRKCTTLNTMEADDTADTLPLYRSQTLSALWRSGCSKNIQASQTIVLRPGIRESVDSLCRDGADVQYNAILKQKPYNFTTNTQKAYLSVQTSSLSAFVISKTHTSGQKPRGKQLNAKVCGNTLWLLSVAKDAIL